MGIDFTELNFLDYVYTYGAFGDTATLGRQEIFYERRGEFAEHMLAHRYQSTCVHSYDVSDYEGATHIMDLNQPQVFAQQYQTIFDGGTLEHIFDVAQALRNIDQMCAPGGQIIHIVPSNNYNGHGFYQFHSDVFYSWYNADRGYSNTEVFYADAVNKHNSYWWRAPALRGQYRQEFNPDCHLYLMMRTQKTHDKQNMNVQATDYEYRWRNDLGSPADVEPVLIQSLLHP
jgi:Methyltransferase domain